MKRRATTRSNKRNLCPPLTFLDKLIYFLGFMLDVCLCFALVIVFSQLQSVIAFSTPDVIAYKERATFLLILPFSLYFGLTIGIFILIGFETQTPLFGSRKIRYGEPPFSPKCLPIFRKRRIKNKLPKAKKKLYLKIIAVWCIVLLLLTSLIPLGLFKRDALYEDNRIEKINAQNKVIAVYTEEDFAHLTIDARGYATATHKVMFPLSPFRYSYEITIEMTDGEKFFFSAGNFDGNYATNEKRLDKLLEIKALFDKSKITVTGADKIDEIIKDMKLNESETAKLNKLFEK